MAYLNYEVFDLDDKAGNGGGSGGGIPEAPTDGKVYGRYNATWTEMTYKLFNLGYLHEGVFYQFRTGSGTPDDPYKYSNPYTPDNEKIYIDLATDAKYVYKGTGYVPFTAITIIDNLLSTNPDFALSANQGRVLKGLIDDIFNIIKCTNAADTPKNVVWYNGSTKITGTLESSADTLKKIYLVPAGDPTATSNYDSYVTYESATSTYSWIKVSFGEAPTDGKDYVRNMGVWKELVNAVSVYDYTELMVLPTDSTISVPKITLTQAYNILKDLKTNKIVALHNATTSSSEYYIIDSFVSADNTNIDFYIHYKNKRFKYFTSGSTVAPNADVVLAEDSKIFKVNVSTYSKPASYLGELTYNFAPILTAANIKDIYDNIQKGLNVEIVGTSPIVISTTDNRTPVYFIKNINKKGASSTSDIDYVMCIEYVDSVIGTTTTIFYTVKGTTVTIDAVDIIKEVATDTTNPDVIYGRKKNKWEALADIPLYTPTKFVPLSTDATFMIPELPTKTEFDKLVALVGDSKKKGGTVIIGGIVTGSTTKSKYGIVLGTNIDTATNTKELYLNLEGRLLKYKYVGTTGSVEEVNTNPGMRLEVNESAEFSIPHIGWEVAFGNGFYATEQCERSVDGRVWEEYTGPVNYNIIRLEFDGSRFVSSYNQNNPSGTFGYSVDGKNWNYDSSIQNGIMGISTTGNHIVLGFFDNNTFKYKSKDNFDESWKDLSIVLPSGATGNWYGVAEKSDFLYIGSSVGYYKVVVTEPSIVTSLPTEYKSGETTSTVGASRAMFIDGDFVYTVDSNGYIYSYEEGVSDYWTRLGRIINRESWEDEIKTTFIKTSYGILVTQVKGTYPGSYSTGKSIGIINEDILRIVNTPENVVACADNGSESLMITLSKKLYYSTDGINWSKVTRTLTIVQDEEDITEDVEKAIEPYIPLASLTQNGLMTKEQVKKLEEGGGEGRLYYPGKGLSLDKSTEEHTFNVEIGTEGLNNGLKFDTDNKLDIEKASETTSGTISKEDYKKFKETSEKALKEIDVKDDDTYIEATATKDTTDPTKLEIKVIAKTQDISTADATHKGLAKAEDIANLLSWGSF